MSKIRIPKRFLNENINNAAKNASVDSGSDFINISPASEIEFSQEDISENDVDAIWDISDNIETMRLTPLYYKDGVKDYIASWTEVWEMTEPEGDYLEDPYYYKDSGWVYTLTITTVRNMKLYIYANSNFHHFILGANPNKFKIYFDQFNQKKRITSKNLIHSLDLQDFDSFLEHLFDCISSEIVFIPETLDESVLNESPRNATRRENAKEIEDGAANFPIPFEDELVYELFKKWNNGEPLTFKQARELKELPIIFRYTKITTFNELKYFTSLTTIGKSTFFSCTSLKSIVIPNSVKSIEKCAFYNCESLDSIVIPNNVTTISLRTFALCIGLTNINIPNSVTNIEESAFENCTKLTSINIPNSVTSIGNYAFALCIGLPSIDIPNSVTNIGKGVFYECNSHTSIILPERFKFQEERLGIPTNAKIEYRPEVLSESVGRTTHQASTKEIEDEAEFKYIPFASFQNEVSQQVISKLKYYDVDYHISEKEIWIRPETIDTIFAFFFKNEKNLLSVNIPNTITNIEQYAFQNCSLNSISLPDSIQKISHYAFQNCTELKQIHLGKNIAQIGIDAFQNCGIENIELPDALNVIPNALFCDCKNLKSVKLGRRLTFINADAFYNCSALEEIVIPDTVVEIGTAAFEKCHSLTSVKFGQNVSQINKSAFANCGITNLVIPNSVKIIESFAFCNCRELKSVQLSKNLETIGTHAFAECPIESIEIPMSIKYVSDLFDDCPHLSSLIYNGKTFTDRNSFVNYFYKRMNGIVESISRTSNHATGKELDDEANRISKLFPFATFKEYVPADMLVNLDEKNIEYVISQDGKQILIPYGLEEIPDRLFAEQSELISVRIPDSVKKIGYMSFYNCSNLSEVKINSSSCLSIIGARAFLGCVSLEEITLPESVIEIRNASFCATALKTLVIPKNVTDIGTQAFTRNPDLLNVKFLGTPKFIGIYAIGPSKAMSIHFDNQEFIGSANFYTYFDTFCKIHLNEGINNITSKSSEKDIEDEALNNATLSPNDFMQNLIQKLIDKNIGISKGAFPMFDISFNLSKNKRPKYEIGTDLKCPAYIQVPLPQDLTFREEDENKLEIMISGIGGLVTHPNTIHVSYLVYNHYIGKFQEPFDIKCFFENKLGYSNLGAGLPRHFEELSDEIKHQIVSGILKKGLICKRKKMKNIL